MTFSVGLYVTMTSEL